MRVYIYICTLDSCIGRNGWSIMATASISAPVAAGHPLRNLDFRLLWMGRTISNLGDQFYLVALPWLVLELTNSSLVLGTVMMVETIPTAELMLVGGAVSDRMSPRHVWIATTATRTLAVLVIGGLILAHIVALWQIFALALIFGAADAFATPAAQTLLPSIVEPEELPAANSLTQASQQFTMIAGPAPAGIIVKSFGLGWAFIVDAVSFLFMIAAIWRLPDPPRSPAVARKSLLHSIGEGLQYINRDAALRSLFLVAAALNFCLTGPVSIGLAWIAKTLFESPIAFSILVSAVALGSLLGVLVAGVVKPRRRGPMMLVMSACIAICSALLGLLVHLWLLAGVLVIMGAAAGFLNIHIVSWVQRRVEREMLGRAMSVLMLAWLGIAPISLLIAGFAVKWSVSAMFLSSATLMLCVTILAATTRGVRDIR